MAVTLLLRGRGLKQSVQGVAQHFLSFLAFGIIPLFEYFVMRPFMDVLGKTRVTMLITLTALPINFVLNYGLIFGNVGFQDSDGADAVLLFVRLRLIDKCFVHLGESVI
uniref:MATE family efflux transporter n=1 Tax=Bacillus maqinnsis TaxID=3229854 RepID=UPI003EC062EE